jgi:preprotein translocase subunit SecD
MGDGRPTFRVIDGDRSFDVQSERIAMSLVVHERKRLDIPVSALVRVEARQTQTFADRRGWATSHTPHVEIWLTPNLQRVLRDFTRDLIDQVMEIFVGGRCVLRPVVRESLGGEPAFSLSANDFAEAQTLATELRTGWRPMRAVE